MAEFPRAQSLSPFHLANIYMVPLDQIIQINVISHYYFSDINLIKLLHTQLFQ